ncbi:hypothetical protein JTB14_036301 [Gonioctena quinquepunctata]|nr:hypothetical protein JTB14_036301 [Gonioctena quinquepunctata]
MGTEKYSDSNSTTTYEEVSTSKIKGPTNSENNVPYKEKKIMTTSSFPRRSWSTPEKTVIREIFNTEISKKEVPTLTECTDAIITNKVLENRTPKQIQIWVLSETKRNTELLKGKRANRWTTPERKACRKYFHDFYEKKVYPSYEEIQQVIEQVPELKNRTPRRTKSHLQHDYKYLSHERWSL